MKLNKSRVVGMLWSAISAAVLGSYIYLTGRNDEKADFEARNESVPEADPITEDENLGADTQ